MPITSSWAHETIMTQHSSYLIILGFRNWLERGFKVRTGFSEYLMEVKPAIIRVCNFLDLLILSVQGVNGNDTVLSSSGRTQKYY
jgi:hypothetical protein